MRTHVIERYIASRGGERGMTLDFFTGQPCDTCGKNLLTAQVDGDKGIYICRSCINDEFNQAIDIAYANGYGRPGTPSQHGAMKRYGR